jgi:hypothetical protein
LNIIHKINLNEENIYETFYCNGQEITEAQFMGVLEDLKNESEEDFEDDCFYNCEECESCIYDEYEDFECGTEESCEKCDCTDCEPISKHPYDIIAEEINEIMEMIYNESCEECLSNKLMSFFMMGIDMGLQGVFSKKE